MLWGCWGCMSPLNEPHKVILGPQNLKNGHLGVKGPKNLAPKLLIVALGIGLYYMSDFYIFFII